MKPIVCCKLREKIRLLPVAISEAACGVPDSEIADVMQFGPNSAGGHAIIAFRFCPWCGKPWIPSGVVAEPPISHKPPVIEGDEWKQENR